MTNPQRKIEHHYVDHANDAVIPVPKLENAVGGMSGHHGISATYAHSSERTFPVTLHFMLNELKSDGLDHIISWQPHGRCFVVHKQTLFVETVLPM
jgi:HSF-type DNA-binding